MRNRRIAHRVCFPSTRAIAWVQASDRFLYIQDKQGPIFRGPGETAEPARWRCRFLRGIQCCLFPPPGKESPCTSSCARRFGGLGRTTGAAPRLRGPVVPGADDVRGRRERDKLTIAEVCSDLSISRRTFYEWRAKGRAPRCITLPNGSLRIRRSEYQRWLASREEAA